MGVGERWEVREVREVREVGGSASRLRVLVRALDGVAARAERALVGARVVLVEQLDELRHHAGVEHRLEPLGARRGVGAALHEPRERPRRVVERERVGRLAEHEGARGERVAHLVPLDRAAAVLHDVVQQRRPLEHRVVVLVGVEELLHPPRHRRQRPRLERRQRHRLRRHRRREHRRRVRPPRRVQLRGVLGERLGHLGGERGPRRRGLGGRRRLSGRRRRLLGGGHALG